MDHWLVLEVLAVAGNLTYTIYMMLNKRIGWLFGIAASALGAYIFLHQYVYAQVALQLFYVVMGVYGWWSWGRRKGMELPITRRPWWFHLLIIALGAAFTYLIGLGLAQLPDAQHVRLDGFITGFSLLATWMLARRILENWAYWIVADAFGIWLYILLGLYWYAGLYAVYVVLSIIGLVRWGNEMRNAKRPLPPEPIPPAPANI
jgi:nicotinamide mononucleotide transporter